MTALNRGDRIERLGMQIVDRDLEITRLKAELKRLRLIAARAFEVVHVDDTYAREWPERPDRPGVTLSIAALRAALLGEEKPMTDNLADIKERGQETDMAMAAWQVLNAITFHEKQGIAPHLATTLANAGVLPDPRLRQELEDEIDDD